PCWCLVFPSGRPATQVPFWVEPARHAACSRQPPRRGGHFGNPQQTTLGRACPGPNGPPDKGPAARRNASRARTVLLAPPYARTCKRGDAKKCWTRYRDLVNKLSGGRDKHGRGPRQRGEGNRSRASRRGRATPVTP